MRFLIDVCVGVRVAEDLIRSGHDVALVSDTDKRMGDHEVLELAQRQERILVTIDKDFGRLIFLDGQKHAGLLRLPDIRSSQRVVLVQKVLKKHDEDLEEGAVITVTGHRVRVQRPLE